MAINFYAGIVESIENELIVSKYVPINIGVTNIENFNTISSGDVGQIDKTKEFIAEPINLLSVLKELYNVETLDFTSLTNKQKIIYFFKTQNIESSYPFYLRINNVVDSNTAYAFLGYGKNGIGFHFILRSDAEKYFLCSTSTYDSNSFDELLEKSRFLNEVNISSSIYDNSLSLPNYSPFNIYYTFSTQNYYYTSNYLDDANTRPYSGTLLNWYNWYTMITGKYYYGEPLSLKLKNPITNSLFPLEKVDRIELTIPISFDLLDEGNTIDYYSEELKKNIPVTTIKFYNSGTDISYIFDLLYGSPKIGTTNSIPLNSGSNLIRKTEVANSFTDDNWVQFYIRGNVNDNLEGIRSVNIERNYDISDYPTHQNDFSIAFNNIKPSKSYNTGIYLLVPDIWAKLDITKWKYEINENFSFEDYYYKNAPLFFATGLVKFGTSSVLTAVKSNYGSVLLANPLIINYVGDYFWQYYSQILDYPISYAFWNNFLTGNFPKDTINIGGGSIGGGTSSSGGGHGGFNDSGSNIETSGIIRNLSSLGSMFTIYSCSDTAINNLGEWLSSLNSSDVSGENKLQSIISLSRIATPNANLPSVSHNQDIIIGGYNSEVRGNVLNSQFVHYNFGNFVLEEYFGNFLDYAPYTDVRLYLPFVGTIELNTDEVMASTMNLKCSIDIITGTVVYILTINKNGYTSSRYSWSGVCSQSIPLSAVDYSGKISSITSGIATGITGALAVAGVLASPLTGGASLIGAAAGGVGIVKGVATSTIGANKKGNYVYSGDISSSPGLNCVKYPYISIERPKMSLPENYGHTMGYPSNITSKIKYLEGYTEIGEVHLEGFSNATQSELDDIESSLKQGVLL